MDCALTSFRDAPPGKRSWEPVEVSDCVFRVEACVDRHDAARASLSHRRFDAGSTGHMGMKPVSARAHATPSVRFLSFVCLPRAVLSFQLWACSCSANYVCFVFVGTNCP